MDEFPIISLSSNGKFEDMELNMETFLKAGFPWACFLSSISLGSFKKEEQKVNLLASSLHVSPVGRGNIRKGRDKTARDTKAIPPMLCSNSLCSEK